MRAAADVGGTFTDILFRLPGGEVRYHKTLSTPPSYDAAVVAGVAHLVDEHDPGVDAMLDFFSRRLAVAGSAGVR